MEACCKASTVAQLVLIFSLTSQNPRRLGQQTAWVKHNIYVVQKSSSPCALLVSGECGLLAMLAALERTPGFDESFACMAVASTAGFALVLHLPAQVQSAFTTLFCKPRNLVFISSHCVLMPCLSYVKWSQSAQHASDSCAISAVASSESVV